MKFLMLLAWKNIIRQKRRTVLTFLVLSVGIAVYIVMVGMVEGYKKNSIDNFINFDTAHIKIRSLQYDSDDPGSLASLLPSSQPFAPVLGSRRYITAWTERLYFLAEADNGRDTLPCMAAGIDAVRDPQVFSLTNYLKGPLKPGGILLGVSLAADLGLQRGDSLYLTFRTRQGALDSIELEITGIVDSPDPLVNTTMVYLNLDEARNFLAVDGSTEIALRTADLKQDARWLKDLRSLLPGYEVLSWRKLSESIVAASKMDEFSTYIFVVFTLIIAVVGIINTMLMSVYEKTREIGTLRAMGMEDRDIRALFVMEGGLTGVLGGLAGVVLGCLLNWYFVGFGYDMSAAVGQGNEQMMAGYRLSGILYSIWHWQSVAASFVLAVACSVLASWYPAGKAVRKTAAECLRTIQ